MTGLPRHNFPKFNKAEKLLLAQGVEVVNPATKGIIKGWTWAQYLRMDLGQLLECDAIYLLKGWHHSNGAQLEYHVARTLNMIIYDEGDSVGQE